MENSSYSKNTKGHLFLRDHLAAQRTILANERTFLAYIRTALTIFIAGVSFIKFFGYVVIELLGWLLIPLGIFTLIKGLMSFRKMNRIIREEEKESTVTTITKEIDK